MAFEVVRTASAARVVNGDMDNRARASYNAARDDLRGRGCQAGGYRMMAADGNDYPLCGRHLAFEWRVYTAYLDDGRVVIVAVDRHSQNHDPVIGLSELLPGLSKVGRRSKDKPPCCEQPDDPPVMNDELRDLLTVL